MEFFLQGALLQASLILALGAQNIFVLNSGLRRQHHALIALTCTICDFTLIFIGVLGAASIFLAIPLLKIIFGILGVGFLIFYAGLKIREAFLPSHFINTPSTHSPTLHKSILTALAFSLLNPHVYLDTVILIGSYAAKFPPLSERLLFGLGAGAFSGLWFFGLAFLAASLHRFLHNVKAMRIISFMSGFILLCLSLKLGLEVWGWVK